MNIDLDIPLDQISADDFKLFFDEFLNDKSVREQSVVKGTIIEIGEDLVTVDIGYKAEGSIKKSEFINEQGELTVKVGDVVDVYLDTMSEEDGLLELSKEKADLMRAWDEISKAVEKDETVKGAIIGRVKGGLAVDIGVKAFLPGSQVDLRPVKNLDRLIGETHEFKIIKFNKKRGNIVLSRRVLLEREREDKKSETLKSLKVNAIMLGTIKNITDYGAFVDLGGIDGLLHITDMSYGRITHPSEMFEVGQQIEVKVLKYDEDSQRVSLGYKQIRPDPWDDAEYKYPVGAIVRGKVVSIVDYGAFVELEDGIEGLVHISDMSWGQRVRHPSERFNKGDEVEARVLNVDVENERFSLSIKALSEDPWLGVSGRYYLGQVIAGKVVHKADFGVFVELEDGIEGLVHYSELINGAGDWQSAYPDNQAINAEIINIDTHDRKVSLSERGAVDRAAGGDVKEILRKQGDSSARLGDIMGDLSRRMRDR